MFYVLIIHQVADYSFWKDIFDKAASIRRHAGEIYFQVLQDTNDVNRVVHYSQWSSLEKAKQFFESEELKRIRIEAGVEEPSFYYLQEADSGVL